MTNSVSGSTAPRQHLAVGFLRPPDEILSMDPSSFILMKTLFGVFSSWKRAIRGIPGVIIGFSLLRLSWGEAAHLIFS